ncbi:hypothetical protein, partial [Azotobacter beijerinckii]|uniref:hypothetical protein n=1 Tax=Azotobacter beijerinckii TaxID=170623 RepID=UPI001C31B58F
AKNNHKIERYVNSTASSFCDLLRNHVASPDFPKPDRLLDLHPQLNLLGPADFLLSNPAPSARQKSRCQTIAPPLGMTLPSTPTPSKFPLRDTVVSDPLRDTKSGKTADRPITIYFSQLAH